MDFLIAFGGFGISAVIIFFAGKKLSWYGDQIAIITGWGKAWAGMVLMATVTSLPELMVGVSSSAIIGAADLAVGDILGSCAFNLFIFAGLDAFVKGRKPLSSIASSSHILSAALGIVLISLVGFAVLLPDEYKLSPWIGVSSILFIIIYFASMRLMFSHENRMKIQAEPVTLPEYKNAWDLKKLVNGYLLFSVLIIIAAISLPLFAKKIAILTGLRESFVGTVFLAISTSLPELAVSISSIRMGAFDLAVGNLLGSNLFNIFILAIDDIFYTNGLLLKDASDNHLSSVLSVIIMSAIVIIGLTYRFTGKRFILAWDAALILLIYMINLLVLFKFI